MGVFGGKELGTDAEVQGVNNWQQRGLIASPARPSLHLGNLGCLVRVDPVSRLSVTCQSLVSHLSVTCQSLVSRPPAGRQQLARDIAHLLASKSKTRLRSEDLSASYHCSQASSTQLLPSTLQLDS